MLFDLKEVNIIGNYRKEFNQLLEIVKGKDINEETGERIKTFAQYLAKEIKTDDFDNFTENCYGRNYIGKDEESGWEAIVMSWKKDNRTAIHGHPQYAGYTVICGEVLLEVFEKQGNTLKKVLEHRAKPFESFYAVSDKNDFENHIHRITGLTEKALTLHIYSDDARKGFNYDTFTISES